MTVLLAASNQRVEFDAGFYPGSIVKAGPQLSTRGCV